MLVGGELVVKGLLELLGYIGRKVNVFELDVEEVLRLFSLVKKLLGDVSLVEDALVADELILLLVEGYENVVVSGTHLLLA